MFIFALLITFLLHCNAVVSYEEYCDSSLDFDCTDFTDQTTRLLLVGKTGSGKSTTGNTILGEELFPVGASFGSVTQNCEWRNGTRFGRNLVVMDSPGFFDTNRTHKEIAVEIVKTVVGMHPGPHAILYVIPVGRYTEEEFSVYERLKSLFDEHLTKYLIVVFTGGERVRQGETVEGMLKQAPDSLKKVLEECEDRYILFSNYAPDTRPQVKQLLTMVDDLNRKNEGKPYSAPQYKQLEDEFEEEVNRRVQEQMEEGAQSTRTKHSYSGRQDVYESTMTRTKIEIVQNNNEESGFFFSLVKIAATFLGGFFGVRWFW